MVQNTFSGIVNKVLHIIVDVNIGPLVEKGKLIKKIFMINPDLFSVAFQVKVKANRIEILKIGVVLENSVSSIENISFEVVPVSVIQEKTIF